MPVFGEDSAYFFHRCELTLISLMQTSLNIGNLPLLQMVMQLGSEMSIRDFFMCGHGLNLKRHGFSV
jgi:hypothetical protein